MFKNPHRSTPITIVIIIVMILLLLYIMDLSIYRKNDENLIIIIKTKFFNIIISRRTTHCRSRAL